MAGMLGISILGMKVCALLMVAVKIREYQDKKEDEAIKALLARHGLLREDDKV